jgi:hypothetical protein
MHFSTEEKPKSLGGGGGGSNTIGLLIQVALVLLKKLPQCILHIIHIPCIKDVIYPTTYTYNIDTRALTANMFNYHTTHFAFQCTYRHPAQYG